MRGNMSRGLESFSRRGFVNVVSICVISCCKNSLAFCTFSHSSACCEEFLNFRFTLVSFFDELPSLVSPDSS